MNTNKLKRALGNVKKAEEAFEKLQKTVMNLRLDAYGDLRMLRDSKLDFDDKELDRLIRVYCLLRSEANVANEMLEDIAEYPEPND